MPSCPTRVSLHRVGQDGILSHARFSPPRGQQLFGLRDDCLRRSYSRVDDDAVKAAVERRPSFRVRAGEDHHAGNFERRGDVRHARVVADQQPSARQQRRHRAQAGAARQIDRPMAHRARHRPDQLLLFARTRQRYSQSAIRHFVGHGGELLRRPASGRRPRSRMDADKFIREQIARFGGLQHLPLVAFAQRKLHLLALRRNAQGFHQSQHSPNLVFVFRVRQSSFAVARVSAGSSTS